MNLYAQGQTHVHSQQLADAAGMGAAQVRRDLMALEAVGTPAKGYPTAQVLEQLNDFFGVAEKQHLALAGVGNLGRALLAYLGERRPSTPIMAAFDADPEKTYKEIQGCTCYPVDWMEDLVEKFKITIAIIAVPGDAAQGVTDRFVTGGVRGILNFAPVPLRVPSDVYVEYLDITMLLDKVTYFAGNAQVPTSSDVES